MGAPLMGGWRNSTICAVFFIALVALVLVTRDDATETSQASVGWPCWLSSCDKQLPSAEAAAKWQDSDENKAIPCALGGACDDLPSENNVARWRNDANQKTDNRVLRDKVVAERNVTPKQDHITIKSEAAKAKGKVIEKISEEGVQQDLQGKLLVQAVQRANSISEQVHKIALGKKPTNQRAVKGLLRTAPRRIAMLTAHPKSRERIRSILSKVQEAEQAKAAATDLAKQARTLQKAALKAQKRASLKADNAAKALSKAKAVEIAHKMAKKNVLRSKAKLIDAKIQVGTALKGFKAMRKESKGTQSASKAAVSSLPDEMAEMGEEPRPVRPLEAATSEGKKLLEQYAEVQHEYAAEQRQTAIEAARLKMLVHQKLH